MTASAAALVTAGTALNDKHKFIQLHSDTPGAAGANNIIGGARKPLTMTVGAGGTLTLSGTISYTGLTPNGAVKFVTIWDLETGGVLQGTYALIGDSTANSAGEYQITGGSIPLLAA